MTNKITIPATIEAAGTELHGINAVLNTRGWARAAIVWAFTNDGGKPGPKGDRTSSGAISCSEFAALGFPGLRSSTTVEQYRRTWQQAIDSGWTTPARPGRAVQVPDNEYPPAVRPGNAAGEQVEDRRPLDRVRSDMRKLTPRQKAEVYREVARDPEVIQAENQRHRELRAQVNPDALTNPADIKASHAQTREAFQPLMDSLANLKVVGAIYEAAELLRASRPGEDLRAEINTALEDLQLARHELDFRSEAGR